MSKNKLLQHQRVRNNLFKKLKEILGKTVKQYTPDSNNYKRNLKKMYEGLVDMNIIEGLDDKSNFKQFEEAFRRSKKKVKEMLIIASLFKENDLGQYYRYDRNKKINSLKIVGGIFLPVTPKKTLDSEALMRYALQLRRMQGIREEIEDFKALIRMLRSAKNKVSGLYKRKDIREIFKISKTINDLETGSIFLDKKKLDEFGKQQKNKKSSVDSDVILDLHNDFENYLKELRKEQYGQYDDLSKEHKLLIEQGVELDKKIDQHIENLEDRVIGAMQIKRNEDKHFKVTMTEVHAESIKDLKMVENLITNDQVKNLTERLELVFTMLEERKSKDKETNESIPNVVGLLQQVIKFKNQLQNISQYCATKQSNIKDPGDIIGYGSGGLNRRSRRGARGNLELFDGPDPTFGEQQEGFGARDFTDVRAQLQTYTKLVTTFNRLLPECDLKNAMYKLGGKLTDLNIVFSSLTRENLIQSTNRGTTIQRMEAGYGGGISGRILNIEEHDDVMKIFNDVQTYLGKTIEAANIGASEAEKFVRYNTDIINQAKKDNKSAKMALLELNKVQDKLDKIRAKYKKELLEEEKLYNNE